MPTTHTYATARDAIAAHLRQDADAHERERYDEIGRRFDALEHAFPRGNEAGLSRLRTAMVFWDAWIDARNHGWQVTSGIQPSEWPVLARAVADDLAADREISNPRVREQFEASRVSMRGDRAQIIADRLRHPEK